VLPEEWFRRPHPRYGTTYRFLNLIVGLQLVTVRAQRGHIYLLGEAYAFGVVWSFALKSLRSSSCDSGRPASGSGASPRT